MEADVTATASGSSSKLDFRMHCVTCGIHRFWTPLRWDCEVCRDYFLCDNCYKESLDESEVLSAPPLVHCGDHPLSAHVTTSTCDGCGSSPIWNVRWHCKVCVDLDLCEACHGRLDAADMPQEHSIEHPMIAVEVINQERFLKFQPSFIKPVDPQWSYKVDGDLPCYGYKWVKRKPASRVFNGVNEVAIQILGNANEDNSVCTSKLKEQIDLEPRNLFIKQASQANQTQGMLDKEHKVFLSHAGREKDFVEQLHRDLLCVHHSGIFFDKDNQSLPKGETFSMRIFDAARHCELAIVVVSHEYFIQKWPMLELATFVEAQKTRPKLKILPVFYKLSVEEFKKQQQLFWTSWKEMGLVSKDEMHKWKEALKVISQTNGLEYNLKMGEVAFRHIIVETISKQFKPELIWDDSHVQGKAQMQEMFQEVIQLSSKASGDLPLAYTLRMGLFGMGGSGKTTMCKVFGNQIAQHYLGKVCLIEFESGDLLQLRVKLLQSICQLASSSLQTIDEGQALALLKTHIPKQRVCLIIDNVSDNPAFIEEARTLLNLPFEEGSLILASSRSSIVLEYLKIERRFTMRVPSLTIKEAKALFSHHAGCDTSSLTKKQMKVMESFVERCNFKVKGMASEEYHPLALKVLGTQLEQVNVEEWQNIRIDFKSYENKSMHPIFLIWRSSFDTLNLEYQRIFLDIALDHSSNTNKGLSMEDLEWQMRCLYGEADKQFSSQVVKVLRRKSLVEYFDVESPALYVHDLYREFAEEEVSRKGLQHAPRCCFSCGSKHQRAIQEGRVRIHDHPVSCITEDILSCMICSEAELLSIQDCAKLVNVDVPGMVNLKMFQVIGGCPQLKSVDLEGAVNLKSLDWYGFEGEYPDLTSLESLEELRIQNDEAESPATLHGCLDFSKTCNLEVLHLSYLPLDMLNLNRVVRLKVLVLENCQHVEQFEGLEALVLLQIVALKACSSLVEFPSLANFHSLESFSLEGAAKLKMIHGFANLSALQVLSLMGGRQLKVLPGIEACTRLTRLDLSGTGIGDCSWISVMKNLTFIDLSGSKIRFVPDCSGLYKLEELWLQDCQALESIGDNTRPMTPTFPQSLQVFSARNCRSVNAVPQFHYESALNYLDLNRTCVEDISGVTYCKQLQKLFCAKTRITNLPDLSSLTRLKVLDVHGCKLLTRMDNNTSLPALEELHVFGCTSLMALPDLQSSTGLTELDLCDCPLVDPNTVKLPSASTIDMEDAAHHNQSDSASTVGMVVGDAVHHNQSDSASIVDMDMEMEDAAHHNQPDTRGGTMQCGTWNDCIVERCSDPEFMHTLKKKMEAMTWIQNIDIEEAFSEGNCCDQSTIVLGTFNVATDNIEFYFESGESMAKLVGVGLLHGKVIVKRGIIFEVQELEPNDWKKVWLEVKECSDESFTIMKVTRPTRGLSDLLQDGGHIASSSSSSTKQGFKGITFAASNSVLEVPCIWELAKFFIMKKVNDVFQNGCNADVSRKSSGTNSKEDCPEDGIETIMTWVQTLKVLFSKGIRGGDDNNVNKSQEEGRGGGSDRGSGGGNGGDDDDSTGGNSKVDDEEEYFTVVNVLLLSGGDCFETQNMEPLSNRLPLSLERLDKVRITSELTFGFYKSRKSKTIQVTTRAAFALDRDFDSIDTCGHFGWFHDVMHVSFGPLDRNIQRNVYLKIDFKEIEPLSGKTTTTASVGRDTKKGRGEGYQARLDVGSSQVARLQLGANTNQEATSMDRQSNEQSLESQINQTNGRFKIRAFPVAEEALLEYEYSAPFFEISADQIQNRRYRHGLNGHPVCEMQRAEFVGTWMPIGSNEVVEYILKADRRLHEISARTALVQSASSSSGIMAFFKKIPEPEVCVSSVLERPVTQVYEKQLFVNHAMAHLINGQTYTLVEGSMPENPFQDLAAPLVTFPVLVDYQ